MGGECLRYLPPQTVWPATHGFGFAIPRAAMRKSRERPRDVIAAMPRFMLSPGAAAWAEGHR